MQRGSAGNIPGEAVADNFHAHHGLPHGGEGSGDEVLVHVGLELRQPEQSGSRRLLPSRSAPRTPAPPLQGGPPPPRHGARPSPRGLSSSAPPEKPLGRPAPPPSPEGTFLLFLSTRWGSRVPSLSDAISLATPRFLRRCPAAALTHVSHPQAGGHRRGLAGARALTSPRGRSSPSGRSLLPRRPPPTPFRACSGPPRPLLRPGFAR